MEHDDDCVFVGYIAPPCLICLHPVDAEYQHVVFTGSPVNRLYHLQCFVGDVCQVSAVLWPDRPVINVSKYDQHTKSHVSLFPSN